jgi:hypothetical protein
MLPTRTAVLISIAVGVALEVGVAVATGRRESWDAGVYWSTGVPLAALAAGAIGYLARGRAWLSPALMVPAQVAAMIYRSGGAGSLWPLTLAFSFVLSLPFVGVALVGRQLRARRWRT